MIRAFFAEGELSARLCVTLLHSLWQVGLLALAAYVCGRIGRRWSVERQYACNVAALVAGLVAMPVTFASLAAGRPSAAAESVLSRPAETAARAAQSSRLQRLVNIGPVSAPLPSVADAQPGSIPEPPPQDGERLWVRLSRWVAVFYGVGVGLMLARLALSVWSANRLGRRGTILRDGPVVERMRTITAQWSLRAVPLLVRVEEIAIPKVVGLVWPKILLPASALSGLSPSQLELVLIHELAHVRRHDMWVNLLQRVAEAVLFFNPAAWYLSRRIATLREFCCDELTCRTIAPGSAQAKTEYALALLRVAELARRPGGRVAEDAAREHAELVALAATGRTTSELRARIASLFGEPVRDPLRLSTGGMLLVAALALALVVGPISWRMVAKSADGKSEQPAANGAATANELSRHAVMIEAESRPRGVSRSFPAIVMASERGKSILLSASWGALPFPLQKNGVPIGALFMRDGNDPVDIIAYDQRLGIGIFSVDRVLDPLSPESFTEEIAVGDRLTELRLSQEDSERTLRVLAVDEAYRDQVDVSGRTVVVEHTIRLDGKMRQNPGSVLLKQGKVAAIFLDNGRYPDTDKGKFFPYALPARSARRAFADLVAAHAAAAKTPGSAEPVFIVARHVMLHDGDVITWDGIRDVLKRMARQGPIHPSFQLTNGVVDQSQQTQVQVARLEREVGFGGFNFGFLWPRAGKRFDAIQSQEDLKPKASEARQYSVRLPDGSPAIGARVVLLPRHDVEAGGGFTIYLKDGQLREPYLEILTQTDAAGLFTVYPTERFELVVLHKAGIAVLNSEQFRYTAITLRPWVKLIGTIDRSDNPQQTVDVTTSLQTSADWPPIQTLEYDLPIAKDGSFQSRVLAPGEIHVTRNIPGDQGVGYMLHVKSIENAQPGSVQRVAIGRMTAADVKSLDSLRGMMEHRAQTAAGRFAGVVRLEGTAPGPEILVQKPGVNNGKPIRDESLRINRTVGNGIANVFIYLTKPPAGTGAEIPPRPFVLKGDAVAFSPRASIARVGQKLRLQDDGPTPANFHLFPERNPGINHVVRAGRTAELGPRFAVAEPLPFDVRDDRFAWKRAFVLVVDHPFAAVSDELGAFEIGDLPPGKYSFRVWHERSGFLDKQLTVEIKPGETTKKTLSYGLDRFER